MRLKVLLVVACALVPVAVWQPFRDQSEKRQSSYDPKVAFATRHQTNGVFFGFDRGERYPLGKDDRLVAGVVQHRYGDTFHFNPQQIATQGLWNFSHRRLGVALVQGRWLLAHQQHDGSWPFYFDFEARPGQFLRAPWRSAMAQGAAIALLARLWRATGDRRYERAAVAALRPFGRTVQRGGVVRRWHGLPLYEEYATRRPTGVLDGFLLALIGLHDFPESPRAQQLWRAGLATARRMVPSYDINGWPAFAIDRSPAPAGYHFVDVALLSVLTRLTGDQTFRHYRDRWAKSL